MSNLTAIIDEVQPLPLHRFNCTRAEARYAAEKGVALLVEDIRPNGRLQGVYTTMKPMTRAIRHAIHQMQNEGPR